MLITTSSGRRVSIEVHSVDENTQLLEDQDRREILKAVGELLGMTKRSWGGGVDGPVPSKSQSD